MFLLDSVWNAPLWKTCRRTWRRRVWRRWRTWWRWVWRRWAWRRRASSNPFGEGSLDGGACFREAWEVLRRWWVHVCAVRGTFDHHRVDVFVIGGRPWRHAQRMPRINVSVYEDNPRPVVIQPTVVLVCARDCSRDGSFRHTIDCGALRCRKFNWETGAKRLLVAVR